MSDYPEKIIDGKKIAEGFCVKIKEVVDHLKEKHRITPGLAVILVSDNPASIIYVRNKAKKTQEIGMNSFEINLPLDTSERNLIKKIESLNNDPKVHGILVQLPLPSHINEKAIINAISPAKDVDGFHVENVGKLYTDQNALYPCTPFGSMLLLRMAMKDLSGKKAVIIGRSNIVGKPMAQLLLQAHCSVSIVHSKTKDIEAECRSADILVAAVGKPELVKANWVKEGAVIIDVGINRILLPDNKTKIVGDVDFNDVLPKVKAITPVPGGVGPMTIATLLYNTLKATYLQKNLNLPDILW